MKALAQIQIDGRTFKLGDFSEYAPLKSPAFTGYPTAPTMTKSDKSTSIATTSFVHSVAADYTKTADLATVATSGSYTDLSNKPSLDYLPLAGGTMSGVITRNGVLAQSGHTSGSITIQNGTAASGGGGIWMYGASHTNKGKVRLQAYDSTHKKYCALDANGDGTLTWCGNTVATTDYVDAAIAAITDADSTGY